VKVPVASAVGPVEVIVFGAAVKVNVFATPALAAIVIQVTSVKVLLAVHPER